MPLTETKIKAIKPAEKTCKYADEKGMYLEVASSGGRWWRLKYRIVGKEKRLSLGVYPDVSLAKARELRDEARKLIAVGIDPSEVRKEAKQAKVAAEANRFEVVTREWLASEAPHWAASHGVKVQQRLERDVLPWLGSRPVEAISAKEVLEVINRVASRGTGDTAYRVKQNIGQIMRYAFATGRVDVDVTSGLKGVVKKPKPGHYAAQTTPAGFAQLLRAIDGFTGTLEVKTALSLAPLVFVRPGELAGARWAEIDLEKGEWIIPAARMKRGKDHLVPLSKQAVALLTDLKPLTGHRELVFPGRDHRKPISDMTLNAALRRLGYCTKTEHTTHGFRASARTLLHEELEIDSAVIEHQLAHRVPDALGEAYNRTKFIKARREMMQRWADYLDDLRGIA